MAPAGDDPTDDPLARSTSGTWSRASLCDLLRGRKVLMLDHGRDRVPLPDWLDAVAGCGEQHWDMWIGRALEIHPLDRLAVARTWRDLPGQPGVALHCRYRAGRHTGLRWYDDVVLDLTGHDGLHVVVGRRDGGPAVGIDEWVDVESVFDFTSTPVTMTYLDAMGTTLRAEGQVAALYGCSAAELVASDGLRFIDESFHDACLALFSNVIIDPKHSQSARLKVRRADGTTLWVETTLINRLADDDVGAIIGLTHDITEQLAAEHAAREHVEQLRSSREEFEILANQVPSAVFRTNGDGEITFANRQWRSLVDDDSATNLSEIVADDDRAALGEMLQLLASPDGPGEAGIEVVGRDAARVLSITCQAVKGPGDGSFRPVIGSMTDVTSTTRLRHLAQHDDLTGLLNRHGFDLRLNDALAADPANVVVAFIDLDGFKSVNDAHGHDAGDAVLRTFSDRLRETLRPSDDVARYGGDEFVILCRQASAGAERAVADRLDRVLETAIEFSGGRWHPSASIGFARARVGEDLSAVLRRADEAMYASKRDIRASGHRSLR
jgi:diguanylate cyclase (GGDEF)-like protein/PAS domain S-box-containing protein